MSIDTSSKAQILREKCCAQVLHGGRPDPVEVVDALTEVEAERDALQVKVEAAETALSMVRSKGAHAAGRKEALEEAKSAIRAACIAPDGTYDMRTEGAIARVEASTVEVACEAIDAIRHTGDTPPMSDQPELLPCPFCGAPATDEDAPIIYCTECYSSANADAWSARVATAVAVKPLEWDEHPDGEGFYAFPNDAGDCLYAITNDVMPGPRWRMFIGGEAVKDPDGDDFSIMVWDDPEPAKDFAQDDLDGRLHRILSDLSHQPPLSPQEAAKVLMEAIEQKHPDIEDCGYVHGMDTVSWLGSVAKEGQ